MKAAWYQGAPAPWTPGPSGTVRANELRSGAGAVARTVPLDWRSRIDGKVGRPKPEEPVGAAGMASSSEDIDRYMLNLLRRQRGGERITIEIGPHTALTLVGAIQWVMRRSDQLNVYAPAMFESFLAELRRVFADEPAALDMIKLHEPPTEAR